LTLWVIALCCSWVGEHKHLGESCCIHLWCETQFWRRREHILLKCSYPPVRQQLRVTVRWP